MEGVTTHQETMEEIGGGMAGNGAIVRLPSLLFSDQDLERRKLVKGVRGSAPPPFLTKTFKMVEDPETNDIICWSSCGNSLIILDHLKLAAEVLPIYFRHSNFSSFIYQLNNYGFKKIGLRQFEYENKWFQVGQEHLLKNIKRRNDEDPTLGKGRRLKRHCFRAEDYGMEVDMEKVRHNISFFRVEILKQKRQLGQLESRIATFQQNAKEMESKSKKLIVFLGSVFGPFLVEKIIQRVEKEQELESHEMVKRRRLVVPQASLTPPIDEDKTDPSQVVKGKNQADESSSPNDKISEKNEPKQCDPYKMWEQIVEDDSASDNDEPEQDLARQHSRFDMALDDMMAAKIVTEVEGTVNGKTLTMDHVEDEVTFELWA